MDRGASWAVVHGSQRVGHEWDSVQFTSVAQSCPTLCDPMNCSLPGLPVHHQLPEFTQTHVHWVGDAIDGWLNWETNTSEYWLVSFRRKKFSFYLFYGSFAYVCMSREIHTLHPIFLKKKSSHFLLADNCIPFLKQRPGLTFEPGYTIHSLGHGVQ